MEGRDGWGGLVPDMWEGVTPPIMPVYGEAGVKVSWVGCHVVCLSVEVKPTIPPTTPAPPTDPTANPTVKPGPNTQDPENSRKSGF